MRQCKRRPGSTRRDDKLGTIRTMDPILRPEAVVRLLRRRFRARMAGIGMLAAGTVGAPFLLACACPSWTAHYVHPVTPELLAQSAELDEDERCALMCGLTVESCELGYMPTMEEPGNEASGQASEPQNEPRRGPPPTNVVMCDVRERQMCGMGRRPEGLVARHDAPPGWSDLSAYVEEAARLESASVVSFVQLATELEAHGAPATLVQAAERAAADEVRHARATDALSQILGAKPRGFEVWVPAVRPLTDVLRENAAVAGVEETFGAWLAGQQAEAADHEGVRALAAPVAIDEARHARLAKVIDGWGRPGRSPAQRAKIDDAVGAAWARLAAGHEDEPREGLSGPAGFPNASRAQGWIATHRPVDLA